ncbi:outer membrane beta-barrel family protein [Mucilaginibacter lappiensis]|uniref:outer membrane beta-barrel family protein n=1 Tax=Mucilaginibacter lappiensis TaxID=354630 RepID=UPI001589E9DD|nr:outer membrane beta-barrel family protein [Mucilaginibacter lappiensis]
MFSFVFNCTFAQSVNKGHITGKIIDSVTNTAVDFATISLFKIGIVTPFIRTSADEKGTFTLTGLPEGTYRLTAGFFGYRIKTVENILIGAKTANVSLGAIMITPVQHQLKEVTIQSKVPILESKIDKLVYNVTSDLTSQGGTATDVLTKVPMVSVDIDGIVELQGNANVRFLINGKPASIYGSSITDALQTIPASQIQRIEVITSPGAKYDAAGTAGIINIILKDNKTKGVNGSVNISAATRLENGSVNLNVKNNNWGISTFFSGNDQLNSNIVNTADRLSFNAAKDTMNRYLQKRFTPFSRNGYQSGFCFIWNITPKDELTATVGINHIITHMTGRTAQDQQTYLSSGIVLSDIGSERISATDFGENADNWSLNYKKTFRKSGRDLNILYSSSYSKNTNYDSQITNYLNGGYPSSGIQSNNPGNDRETDISVDYTEPVAKGFQIEAGLKTVLENINNSVVTDTLLNNGTFINDNGQTYKFNFKRNIYAGYVSTSFSLFNDFLNGKAGIRYERTDTHSDLLGIHIPIDNIWSPNLLVLHKLEETQSIKFAYTYRIERPDYDDLNPFLDIIDPHNIATGEPLLKNEIGHKFELGYNKTFANNSSVYIGGFYSYNNNDIQSFTTFYPVYTANGSNYYNVSLSKSANIGSQTIVGINLSGSATVTERLTLRTDILLLSKNNSVPGLPSVGGFSYKANLNVTYRLSDGLIAEAFGIINSKRTDFQNIRPGSYIYTFAVKKQLFDKKASFGYTTTNPFNQYINQYSSAYGTGFTQTNLRQKTLRSFGITLSYKFGKLKTNDGDNDAKT